MTEGVKKIADYKVPKGIVPTKGMHSPRTEWLRSDGSVIAIVDDHIHWGAKFTYYTPSGRRMDEYGDDGYRKCVNNIRAVSLHETKTAARRMSYDAKIAEEQAVLAERFTADADELKREYMKGDDLNPGHLVEYRLHADEIRITIGMNSITDEQVKEILAILRS